MYALFYQNDNKKLNMTEKFVLCAISPTLAGICNHFLLPADDYGVKLNKLRDSWNRKIKARKLTIEDVVKGYDKHIRSLNGDTRKVHIVPMEDGKSYEFGYNDNPAMSKAVWPTPIPDLLRSRRRSKK